MDLRGNSTSNKDAIRILLVIYILHYLIKEPKLWE